MNKKCIVVKVGTSTLTYSTGKINIGLIEELAKVLSDIQNSGTQVVLVSSGAIGVGAQKLGLGTRPRDTSGRQAAAGVGQSELMFMYDKFFSQYGNIVAQLLLTKEDVLDEVRKNNLENMFSKLFEYGAIPIVNENDSVSTDELEFGDNDTLSAITASLIGAQKLIILTDKDGLFTKNPDKYPEAELIPTVEHITPEIESLAGGAGSELGTGGMITKIAAAKIAANNGIDTAVINGQNLGNIYGVLDGEFTGTLFKRQ